MLIGIVGTHGAGKGAVVQFLKERGFIHCSAREYFIEELQRRGVTSDRPAISALANELREKYGIDHIVRVFLDRYDPAVDDIVIESIYTMGEVSAIRAAGGFVVAVDADPEIRYERITARMSETDKVSKEEFIRMQAQEANSDDPTKQNARAVMENADFHITNDSDLEALRIQVNYVLEKIEKGTEEDRASDDVDSED